MTTQIEGTHGESATAEVVSASTDRRGRRIEALVLGVAFVLVNLACMATQKPFYFHDDEGWEGVSYLSMARQVAVGSWPLRHDAPEVYRVGSPYFAGLLQRGTGRDLLFCFKIVNGTANALGLALLVVWLRRFLRDWRVRTALGLAFLLQWDTPTRWMYFFPPHTDPWMWVFLFAGLIAVERYREQPTARRLGDVAGLMAVGVCFREVVLVVACAVPFVNNPLPTSDLRAALFNGRWDSLRRTVTRMIFPGAIPLAAGVLAMAAVRLLIAHQDNTYSFALTAVHSLYEKPWPTYLHGWFLAFGPILWLAIFQGRKATGFLASHQHLAVYLAAFAVLGYIGGTDTERLLYWSMPVVYVLIGQGLENRLGSLPVPLLVVLAAAQAVADRAVFWPIPDYPTDAPHAWPLFTPFGRDVPFMDLYGYWEPRLLALTSLLTYFAFGAVLAAWFTWRASRLREAPRILPDAG